MRSGFLWLLIPFLVYACSKKQLHGDVGLLGLDYYPTKTGKYVIYDVDSTVYTDLPKDTITYKYRIKEKFESTFTDNEGKESIRLERYIKMFDPKKPYDSIAWKIKEVWWVNATNNSVQVVESNVRYTKLIFPIEEKAFWNGNALNSKGERQYSYDYIERSEKINNTNFDKVLLVKQLVNSNAIIYQNYFEKYSKGIGLVYREITDVISNSTSSSVPVLKRIESGLVYKQTYVSSGYE